MKTIILDTNFLIYCAKYKIDLFTEIERICFFTYKIKVLDATIRELEKVKPKELGLIKKYLERIEIIKSENSYVDKELIKLSKEGCIIATEDNLLKKELKDGIITVRQMKYLQFRQ